MADLRQELGLSDACFFGCPEYDFPNMESELTALEQDVENIDRTNLSVSGVAVCRAALTTESASIRSKVSDAPSRCTIRGTWRPEKLHSAMPQIACGTKGAIGVIPVTGIVVESTRP